MRTFGRLLALGAICAGTLGLTAVPATALTISVGGSKPTLPLPLPLPVSVTAGVDNGGLHTDVQAPGSTEIAVNAGPSGVKANATVGNHPLVDARVEAPTVATIPHTDAGAVPLPQLPPVLTPAPTGAPASPSPPVASDQPGAGPAPSARVATAPRSAANTGTGGAPIAERDIRTATPAGDRTPDVSGELASHPSAGLLNAMTGSGARILLWIALAGAVIALRLFVGSATSKATRAG